MGRTGARFLRAAHSPLSSRRGRRAPELPLSRLIASAAAAAMTLALLPVTAFAAASPSPSLDTLLAAPPASDYKEDTQGLALEGSFGLKDYVDFLGPADPSGTQTTLQRDGFVSGYGRSWVQQASSHLLLEIVIAFSGGSGAKNWLGTSQELDKADQFYKSAMSITGIETAYGVHFADPTTPAYADVAYFVKGNDYFIIGLVSGADDLGDSAPSQTRRQYDTAPPYTIPPSQWPESARSILTDPLKFVTPAAYVLGGAVAVAVLAALIVLLVWRRRPRAHHTAAIELHVSPDGRYWWDGHAWRESSHEIPPNALRSDDGNYWWDGGEWRLIREAASSA
ncbi:MAG TPA: hypothetical protein VEM94_08955 [Candidatus Dormibacteraeota bacterium]|nr:hypothetical protein [Candidatus Dormibacteraeota bacterium]